MYYFDEFFGHKILKSDKLENINAFFTTRDVDEKKLIENISDNYKKRVVKPIQTHSDNVEIVDLRDDYPDTDGLIVNTKNLIIYLRFADCTPVILFDSHNNIGAIAHAGWRGTSKKISVKTVEKMVKTYGSKPENITALIGPAIGLCCYEVSDEVKESCLSTVKDKTNLFIKNNIDLKNINKRQLEEIGVRNIDAAPFCTSCNNDLFYSYRKENGTDKRHFAVLEL